MQIYTTVEQVGANAGQDYAIVQEALRFFTEGEYKAWKNTMAGDTELMARFNGMVAAHKYGVAPNVKADMTKLHGFEIKLGQVIELVEKELTLAVKTVSQARIEEIELYQKFPRQTARVTRQVAPLWQEAEKIAQRIEVQLVNINTLERDVSFEASRLIGEIGAGNVGQMIDPVLNRLKHADNEMTFMLRPLRNLIQRLINHIQARWI